MNPSKDIKDMSSNELKSLKSTLDFLKGVNPSATKMIKAIDKELKRRSK